MKIKTKNLSLRTAEKDDKDLQNLFESYEQLKYMSERRLHKNLSEEEVIFRIELSDELVGETRIKDIKWFNRKAELSIMILPEFQNKGFAGEAIERIIDYAFHTMNLHRLEAEVIKANKPSSRLVEKFGFKLEGTLREAKYVNGNYDDILVYGLLKPEWTALQNKGCKK
ncbi:MAG: GNAT family N-acetyltransferase [Bacteroidetes bacterium]|nr:GNAT family N-acetyltransferase [Bacteroidota bacterium]MBU2505245.1 GNAT family N-acetyltransferase [Bacteroidota bacterium]